MEKGEPFANIIHYINRSFQTMEGYGAMNDHRLDEKITEAPKTIFTYCMARTPNRQEAEDLCQDILCELVKSSRNLRDHEGFYAFMWSVAGDVYKQWCRKRAKGRTFELTDEIAARDRLEFEEDDDLYLLRRELSLLSEKYRRATILYYIDRMSCSEIADSLHISESMVKYLLFKSRKKLKEGMMMERKLGALSYNPKNLIPNYNGSGPNRFWDFMQSKVRQNIVNACYNDALTAEQISLETGIPLAYLDEEIQALLDKEILVRDASRCKANVIILTSDYADEIGRQAAAIYEDMAGAMRAFLETRLEDFRSIGFQGNGFSDASLRWQLMTFVLSQIVLFSTGAPEANDASSFPKTAWGDHAYVWLVERDSALARQNIFNISQVNGSRGGRIHFLDYLPRPKATTTIFTGTRGMSTSSVTLRAKAGAICSEYDLEAVAQMIKKGYVLREGEAFRVAMPVFRANQYTQAMNLAKGVVCDQLGGMITQLDRTAAKILSEHTPPHLQNQAAPIAKLSSRFVHAVCAPASILVDTKVLSTDWNPLEMPTTFVVLDA